MQVVRFELDSLDPFTSFNSALGSFLSPFYTIPNADGTNAWQKSLTDYLEVVFLTATGKGVEFNFVVGTGNAGTLQVAPTGAGAFEVQYSFANSIV